MSRSASPIQDRRLPFASRSHEKIDKTVIWQMLQFIPADDRDIWIKIGMALKSELGNDGFSFFDEWSKSSAKYRQKSTVDVWRSFKGGSISIGTLIHMAKENGWRQNNSVQPPIPKITTTPITKKTGTQTYALKLWLTANKWMSGDNWLKDNSDKVVTSHPYAISKGIQSAGGAGRVTATGSVIGKNADCVIVPVRNIQSDKVQSVQCINSRGTKQSFGPISGGALILGNTLDKSLTWYVCEGWASAVSMVFHHQNGNGVCAASFGKTNQKNVAELLDQVYGPKKIRILEEVD